MGADCTAGDFVDIATPLDQGPGDLTPCWDQTPTDQTPTDQTPTKRNLPGRLMTPSSSGESSPGRRASSKSSCAAIRPGSSRTSPGWSATATTRSISRRRSFSRCSRRSTGTTRSKVSTWLFPDCGQRRHRPPPEARAPHRSSRNPGSETRSGVRPSSTRATSSTLRGAAANVQGGRRFRGRSRPFRREFRELITLRHFGGCPTSTSPGSRNALGPSRNKLFRANVVLKERLAGELS